MNRNLETLMQKRVDGLLLLSPKRINLRVKSCNVIRQCLLDDGLGSVRWRQRSYSG